MKKIPVFALCLLSFHFATAQFRLIARAAYGCDSQLHFSTNDSVTYRYSGSRTGDIKTGNYLFDSSVQYALQSTTLQPHFLYLRSYGDSDRVMSAISAKMVGSTWRNMSRNLYAYFSNTRYDSTMADTWDTVANNWQGNFRYKYFYTGTRLDSVHWTQNVSSIWKLVAKEIDGYSGGNLSVHNTLVWTDSTSTWDSLQSETYTYNTSGVITNYTMYGFDNSTGFLGPLAKQDYACDAGGRMTEHTYSYWSSFSNRWEGNDQHLYSIGGSGLVDVETVNLWDPVAQSWGPYRRLQFTYDSVKNISYILTRAYTGFTYLNFTLETRYYNNDGLLSVTSLQSWNDPSNKWQPAIGNNALVYYYYDAIPNDVAHLSAQYGGLSIYPNPAIGILHVNIQWKQSQPFIISAYDVQGRRVLTQTHGATASYSGDVPINNLQPGMYIIRATNGNEEMTKQLIVGNQ